MGCFLGLHKWGDWEAVPGKCEEKEVCTKCGDVKTRPAHRMSDWAPIPGQCKSECHCMNPWCKYTEFKDMPHTYGEWAYYEDGCCTQKRSCTVCGKADYREQCPKDVETIEVPGECRVIKRCPRCGVETTEAIPHDWSERKSLKDCLIFRIETNEEAGKEIKVLPVLGRPAEGGMGENLMNKTQLMRTIAEDKAALNSCAPDACGRVCKKCLFIQKLGKRG